MIKNDQIVFESVNMGYENSEVLEDISLTLELGKIHCVFGRNGGGKTTFLKSLASMLPLKRGRILLNNRNLSELSSKEKAHQIATVLTTRPNIVNMNVLDFISYGRYPYTNWLGIKGEEDFEIIEQSIEDCEIQNLKSKFLGELSDGEMQKVQIARALAQDVPILLLDEPASHLDLVNKAAIFNLLKKACIKNSKTILFTSHDIQFALQLADDFIIINDKKAVQMGVAEIKSKKVIESILNSDYLDFNPESNSLHFKSSI